MKLVLGLIGVFGLLMSLQANAQLNASNDPFAICNTFSFDSGKANCVKEINKGRYYDSSALDVCKTYSFDSGKLDCVQVIRDKAYYVGELNVCSGMSFDSKKTECLRNSGQTYEPGRGGGHAGCPTVGEVKRKLGSALRAFENGNYQRGVRLLTNAYYDIEDCD